MTFFLYIQQAGGEEAWQPALADSRAQIVATAQPRFVTVLDVSAAIDETFTREQIDELKYRGPFYADFDGEDIVEVLDKFRTFLGKLTDLGVDPNMLRLYATGGRGFHVEAPWEIFIAKPPKQGVQRLPLIYKEIAYELFVDTLDLRVYSARKGRMWRTPNTRRENGRFKVPISAVEAMEMTVEDYPNLCATPRASPPIAPPTLCNKFAVLYAKAEAKLEAAMKRRKTSKQDGKLLSRFKGAFPPSLLKVMAGEGTAENIGFHKIALQIVITTHALGKTEDQMLAACEGLLANHVSDGQRYNTPARRRGELQRLFRYTEGNPCYEYRRDAVRSLLPKGASAPDLDGLTEDASGAITAEGEDGNAEGLLGGVFVTEKGVFRRTETGALKISDVSFKDVCLLYAAEGHQAVGFELEVLLNGRSRGRHYLEQQALLSKQKYLQFCMQHMGIFTGTDNMVSAVAAILRDTAMKNNKVVYVTNREGLDLIQRPDSAEPHLDFVWVSPCGVKTDSPVQYKLRGANNTDGLFKSDLLLAPDMQGDEETAEVIEALLNFNEPYVVANLLGWFTAAFHRQIYHRSRHRKFPLLQAFGQSGAGKSTTISLLLRMHYYLAQVQLPHADSYTPYAASSMLQSSASIPVIFDEFKPRQMRDKVDRYRQMFRAAYNAGTLAKGSMNTDLNASWKNVSVYEISAPVGFIGEALETETALLERSVSVPLSKGALLGREKHESLLNERAGVVSSLGKEIVRLTFAIDPEAFIAMADRNIEVANRIAFKRNNHRVVFNLGVVITGLEFLSKVVAQHFGDRFAARFAALREASLDVSKHVSVSVMPEAAKVLNILAHMSRTEERGSEHEIRETVDYMHTETGDLDLLVRNCYYKYVSWARRKGQTPLYDNEEAFAQGLGNYAPLKSKACPDSALKTSGMERVYRFDGQLLKGEGVEPFRT